jgi:hypothetical protein
MEPFVEVSLKYTLENDEEYETPIKIYKYTERSVAMLSSEHFGKSMAEELKNIGASYNDKLKIGKGWVFSNGKYPSLQALVERISKKEVKGKVPYVPPTRAATIGVGSTLLGALPTDPKIVSKFRDLMNEVDEIKNKSVVISNGRTYVYGKKEDVEKSVQEMGKPIVAFFSGITNSIAMC